MGCVLAKKVNIDRILRGMVFKCLGVKCHYVDNLPLNGQKNVCMRVHVWQCSLWTEGMGIRVLI